MYPKVDPFLNVSKKIYLVQDDYFYPKEHIYFEPFVGFTKSKSLNMSKINAILSSVTL